MRLQEREYSNLLTQRSADDAHPRTRPEPARFHQLNKSVAFAPAKLGDDSIRNVRRFLAVPNDIHDARTPSRVPPAANHPYKQIVRKQRRRDCDLSAVTAALLAQQWLIDVVTGQP